SKEGQQAIATEGLGYLPLNAQEVAEETAKLEPSDVTPPKDAPHASSDGAIHIVGDAGMEQLLAGFNRLFTKTHPGTRFEMLLKGSCTGLAGLTAGVSAFALVAREAGPYEELRPFRQVYGYEPTDIHIGRAGYTAPRRRPLPGIYV